MHEATSELALLDWKRTKSIREENPWRLLKEPIGLPDTNGWLYALQLNVYSYILSTEYGYDVSRMYLGQVHPTLSRARLIEVPKLEEHMALLIEDQISRGLAVSEAAPGPDSPFLLPTQKKYTKRFRTHVYVYSSLPAPGEHAYRSSTFQLEPCPSTPAFNIVGAFLGWRLFTRTPCRYPRGGGYSISRRASRAFAI